MNDKQTAKFKEKLLRMQTEIGDRADQLVAAIGEQETPPGEHERRVVPAGATEPDWTLEQVQEHMGQQILRALERISLGSYGTCQQCGEAIPLARLEALPHAEYCVVCSTKLEK
jgi:DnaK suppressor protein